MDSKKSKKTRSHAEASKPSKYSVSSPSPFSSIRPPLHDRVKSAPSLAQSSRHQNGPLRKTTVNIPSGVVNKTNTSSEKPYSSTSILEEPNLPIQIATAFGEVRALFIASVMLQPKLPGGLADECFRLEIEGMKLPSRC